MHVGRHYKFREYLVWTRWEIFYLLAWALFVTLLLEITRWHFLTIPVPLLTVVGSAVAIILAFKNQQCYTRITDALALGSQVQTASIILANKLAIALNQADEPQTGSLKQFYYRHFAWLTALRYFLRDPKIWENTFEPGNARFLAELPTPESQSPLKEELKKYLSDAEIEEILAYRGDREGFILRSQYTALGDLHKKKAVPEYVYTALTGAVDDLARLQGNLKRIKNYPYARNYYSIAVILVRAFVCLVPFGLFMYALDLGKSAGIEHWTAWLNVPFSVTVGWIFVTLEKVGENSSNPFEGGPNDVPISFFARRIEIEMRTMLGEQSDLKPLQPKHNILF